MIKKALEGIKVLECCTGISASFGVKLMAEMGAEAIKIEPPGTGDQARKLGAFPDGIPHPEKSGLFAFLNANKAGVTLDIEKAGGRKLLKEIAKNVDVLVEDAPSGGFDSLGLGYEELKKANPGLIMASLTPFGEKGPYKDYKAYPLNTSHACGQAYIYPIPSDDFSREPLKVGGNVEAFECGLMVALATLAAVVRKRASGKGQHIRTSSLEIGMYLMLYENTVYPEFQTNVNRLAENAKKAPGGILPCKDGDVVLNFLQEVEWDNLVKLLGSPAWAKEDAYKDRMSRMAKIQDINKHIIEWMKDKTKKEIVEKGQALGVPVTPVNTPKDVLESEQMKVRGFFSEIEHPELGVLKFPKIPAVFSKTPPRVERPAPLLGQDNEAVFCGQLGYSKKELEAFKSAGVI